MILRRVIQHVKKQEWTAVAIDFMIVVLGVFVGIQVQQWSNERGERQLERVYLERILSDINISIETNELNVKRLAASRDGQVLVLGSLRRCSLPTAQQDAFADGITHLNRVAPSVFVLSTVDEMLSAGKFSIIRNSKVRDTLNGLARDEKYQHDVYIAKVAQISEPANIANARMIRIYTAHKTPFDPVRWDELDLDFNALCQDREFMAAVSSLRNITDAGISLNNRALDKLHTAKSVLGQELGIAAKAKETAP